MKKIFLTILTLTFVIINFQLGLINANALSTILIPLDTFSNYSAVKLGLIGTIDSDFNVNSGNVDVKIPGTFKLYPNQSSNMVDLNGFVPGELRSNPLAINAGDILTLSFDYGGNFYTDNVNHTALVSLDSFSQTITATPGTVNLTNFSKTFTATGTSNNYLNFLSSSPSNEGVVITNISLSKVSSNSTSSSSSNSSISSVSSSSISSSTISSVSSSSSCTILNNLEVVVTCSSSSSSQAVTGGGAITIGGVNSQSLSSISNQTLSSSSNVQSERKGVLGFSTTREEQASVTTNTTNPTKIKILASSELKTAVDSAKGMTVRTGGSDN